MYAVIRSSIGVLVLQLGLARGRTFLMALRIIPLVAVWLACSVGAIHADVSERFALAIRLRVDPSLTSRRMIERVKAETEAIWGLYGVRLAWTDAGVPESPANTMFLDASVVRRFERRLEMAWPAELGRTVLTRDAPLWRPIRLSFDATEHALAHRARIPLTRIVLDPELARALGRVLAHEIGHALLGPPHHDLAGLMRASFRAEELGDPDRTPFRLTCGGVERLTGRLRALSADPQRVPSVGASCIPAQSGD